MDEKLTQVLHKVELLCEQNPEFRKELCRKMGVNNTTLIPSNTQLDEIYEYCIERVVRKQATEYYASFPIESIRQQLIEDYCRMERFHRLDDFGDFCLAAYQQIECICKTLVDDSNLLEITQKLWAYPAYVYTGEWKNGNYEQEINISVTKRAENKSNFRVADIVFPGKDKIDNIPNANKKYSISLSSQSAVDLIRMVVYFVCCQAMLKYSEYEYYNTICKTLNELYQCRNLNHRGNAQTDWQKEITERVLEDKASYYFVFLGELVHFVKTVSDGIKALPELASKIREMPDRAMQIQIQMPKIISKIEIKDDGKRRFR